MSDDKRNETGLVCDILGLESLVDEITSKLLLNAKGGSIATPSAILGPFYREGAPLLPNESNILLAAPDSEWYKQAEPLRAHISGRVVSVSTGKPVANAMVDLWLAGPNGLYEQQDPTAPEMNLRGRFLTDDDGRYALYALRPTAYPVPLDGPAGQMLQLLDRQAYRPAHIHFVVTAEGYGAVTTQVFDDKDVHLEDDSVFAVKDELIVQFKPREGDPKAHWTLTYDFALCEV